jgi:putative transposase
VASIGSVGDAYDNALAESIVDSFKTELIADRVWCSRSHLELAVVEYIGWFNHDRLHESLGDVPPVEFEQLHAARGAKSDNGSVTSIAPSASEGLTTHRISPVGVDLLPTARSLPRTPSLSQPVPLRPRRTAIKGRTATRGLSDP